MNKKAIFSIVFFYFIQWYDATLFGHLSYHLSELFFPNENKILSLLMSLSAFAVTFIAKPFGALIFGYFGDKYNRQKTLMISIGIITFATFAMAMLPTYNQIGISAPILLFVFRIIQGLAFGGEAGGPVILSEHVGKKYLALSCSALYAVSSLGVLFGYVVVNLSLNSVIFEKYGVSEWRFPFLLGSVLTFCLLLLRKKVFASSIEAVQRVNTENPLKILFAYKSKFILGCGIEILDSVGFYTLTLAINILINMEQNSMNIASYSLIMLIFSFCNVTFAYISIKLNKMIVLIFFSICLVLSIYPIFNLILSQNIIGYILLAVLLAGYMSIITFVQLLLFPSEVRQLGYGLSNSITVVIFGGTTPAVCVWLTEVTGLRTAPAFYIMAAAAISLVSCCIIYFKKYLVENE